MNRGYKCSVRTPWYAVPSVYVPDAFVFRQIYDFPRIVLNRAEATATDTIHRLRSYGSDPSAIVANSYSYLTAASAEIEGRSYGGGVLELEPTEAEKLLMPATLGDAMPIEESDGLIRAGRLEAVSRRKQPPYPDAASGAFKIRVHDAARHLGENAEPPSRAPPRWQENAELGMEKNTQADELTPAADDPVAAKESARAQVAELVKRFRRNEAEYRDAGYNETQARTEFITPLLEAFGWDVHNRSGQPLIYREVIEEATVEVGEERLSKRPDYELRLARQRKIFIEAKKPSVRIDRDRAPAFQTRRYGYSASLPISVVTNFYQLVIYDCKPLPRENDEAHVARLHQYGYGDLEARFDELWFSALP